MRTTLPTSTSLKALSGQSYDVGYTYTADGQVASTTLPKVSRPDGTTVMGKETVTTVYDDVSMPHWQTGGFGWGTYVAESMFDAQGLRSRWTWGTPTAPSSPISGRTARGG